MRDYLYVKLYHFFSLLLQKVPEKFIIVLMKLLANIAYLMSSQRRKIINKNLDLAFGQTLSRKKKKEIGIDAFINLIDTTFGIMRRDNMQKDDVIKNITFEGLDIIKKYQNDGKNFILITGHYGNWELLSQAIAIKFNLTLVGIGKKLDSEAMDKILKTNREKFNVEMIYRNGAMKNAIKVIAQKKTLGILVDQHISPNISVNVHFFNHLATHTPIASILSRKFNLDLIPIFISTTNYKDYHVKIYNPIKSLKTPNQHEDLGILTQEQANIMQEVIKTYPNQWFWMHRRWKI
jgi:KDO2-lipid IV(A) lauroyltransferase